jgi:hypothetical protein
MGGTLECGALAVAVKVAVKRATGRRAVARRPVVLLLLLAIRLVVREGFEPPKASAS